MRKLHALLLCSLLFVTACTPVFDNRDEVIQETTDEDTDQSAIVPNYRMSDENYRMILTEDSSKVSTARTVTTNQMGNRLDISEFESGLRRHSKEYYDPENYYFQPGQFLSGEELISWLSRGSDSEEGLNPELDEDSASVAQFKENPKYISNIVEQDFLVKSEENVVEVKGVTIGISLRTVYNFTTEGKDYQVDHSTEELMKKGKEYASTILQRLRENEKLADVPVVFALYEEAEASSKVPGKFLSKTYVEGADMSINNWKDLNETHVLFPSSEARENYFDDSQIFSDFRTEVSNYFPNFVGMIANGFYINDELQEVSINIPIQFRSQSEVVGFTQYVYSLVVEMFPEHYDVEVNIYSMDRQESLIVREAGAEEPFVHIYK
ncbi:CamS family sex pheromone protein [Halobacillus locisalis]|uniref:CamS family sex pheromone protein n=1 Tax=Halobacillus locisalis TaxID=220753 RepID=A0A838CUZ4_9BACI|nr:CamS family sex pheromone protein [Halobacillus locisalis]MBA2175962.1 CamS family sex pheromone protein [Halobacillus locisalis]